MLRVKCQVARLEAFCTDIYRVLLKPAQSVEFKAGQYLMVVMGEEDKRPFSIASHPSDPSSETAGLLELHIGATGDYALQVIEKLREGSVDIELPGGKAWLRETSKRPLLLVAGGTGFSYIQSVLMEALAQSQSRPVFLYWGAKRAEYLYALEQVAAWANTYDALTFTPVVEEAPENWSGKQGLVHQAVMADFVSLEGYDIYVAGRFEMAGVAREDFFKLGAEAAHLYGDAFEFI